MLVVTCAVLLALAHARVRAGELLLVASSGCFSHDLTLRSVGTALGGVNVTWAQVKVFDFGRSVPLPRDWRRLVWDRVSSRDSHSLHHSGAPLVWLGNIPFEPRHWLDWTGVAVFLGIVRAHRRHCLDFVRSSQFAALARSEFDLVVVDHFVQECLTAALAGRLRAPTISYSNWPVSDGYVGALNVPSFPAAQPTTGTTLADDGMRFADRLRNAAARLFVAAARGLQRALVWWDFGRKTDLFAIEANHLLYTVRSDFLLEPVRPINNRVKFFGCDRCQQPASVVRNSSFSTTSDFVVVTFGSIANFDLIPAGLLRQFLRAFGSSRFHVLWQTNSEQPQLVLQLRNVSVPRNVRMVQWLPMQTVLAHPKLQYVVTHGGINTVNEVVHAALPVIGIPLQGDQNSNLQSLRRRGLAQLVRIVDVHEGKLKSILMDFEDNLDRFRSRAMLVSSMLKDYRRLTGDNQGFWTKWALNHGKTLNENSRKDKFFHCTFITFSQYFGLFDFLLYSFGFVAVTTIVTR